MPSAITDYNVACCCHGCACLPLTLFATFTNVSGCSCLDGVSVLLSYAGQCCWKGSATTGCSLNSHTVYVMISFDPTPGVDQWVGDVDCFDGNPHLCAPAVINGTTYHGSFGFDHVTCHPFMLSRDNPISPLSCCGDISTTPFVNIVVTE
jgi:hypothetical protein